MNKRIGLFRRFYIILLLLLLSACSEKDPIGMKWKFKGTFKPINYLNQGFSGPIVTDNIVYFGTKGQLYSLDIEKGREKWMFKAGHPEWGPDFFVMSDEIIGVWSKNTLHAVDATTGQEKWIFTCKGVGRISPIVSDGVVYLGRRGERGGRSCAFICGRYQDRTENMGVL